MSGNREVQAPSCRHPSHRSLERGLAAWELPHAAHRRGSVSALQTTRAGNTPQIIAVTIPTRDDLCQSQNSRIGRGLFERTGQLFLLSFAFLYCDSLLE